MRRLTKLVTLLIAFTGIFGMKAGAQVSNTDTILNPADPVITYNASAPPSTTIPPGQIVKWVRTVRLGWNTDSWKCYYYNGIVFRLKFPKTYNRTANDGKKYPMMVFFHGLGEAGPITDNEYQLYHGGEFFTYSVDNGTFDGYVLAVQSQGFWGGGHYQYIRDLIDYMITKNKLDPFQVSINGLSAGGAACWDMQYNYPQYVSAALPMSWTSYYYGDAAWVNKLKFTPIWNFQGGLDGAPTPYTSRGVRDAFLAGGANYAYTEYPELGHGTWNTVWNEPDFWGYQKRAYASNPWPLNGRNEFCPLNDPINVTLGAAPGFDNYEWRKDGVVVQTGSSNTLQATALGTYDLRVQRSGIWSEFSRVPVVIKLKGATVTPNIKVSGLASKVLPSLDGSTSVQLELPSGYASYEWQRVGSTAVLGTSRTLSVSTPADYRAKVTEAYGCSSDFSSPFTVVDANGPNKPDPAINLLATTLSQTSIRLDWSDNPSPQFNETNFEIYQGTQQGGPYVFAGIVGQDIRTFTLTGLNPNTRYYFKVRAVNNTGAAAGSNETSGATQVDTQAPTAPTNLAVLSTTRNSISLSWNASTDNVGVVRYEIYVNGQGFSGTQKSFATTGTNFTISGLVYPNSYNISVKAVDFAGNASAFSNQVTGQPLLTGIDYKYYVLDASPSLLPDFNTMNPTSKGTQNNISIANRTQEVNFAYLWEGFINVPVAGTYNFRTTSDDGTKLYLGALNGTGSPYGMSSLLKVTNDGVHGMVDATSADLTLAAGTYPISIAYFQGVGGYGINVLWKTPQTSGNYTTIPDSAFVDKTVVNGTVPAKPTALTATTVSYRQIDLTFTDNSTNETAFEIWRSVNPLSNFVTIGRMNAVSGTGTRTYKDSTLSPNTRYYYRVRAINTYGESAFDKDGQGVDYDYYEANGLSALPNFNAAPMTTTAYRKSGRVANFGLGMQARADEFQLRFTGTINLPSNGIYTFYTSSDDGSKLYIDGVQVVDNDFTHGIQERYGSKSLTAGAHSIMVTYFESVAGEGLTVKIACPGILPKQTIPDSYLGNALTNAATTAPPGSPNAPTTLLAAPQSKSVIKVTWTDNATNETKYELYRSSNNNSNFLLYASLAPNTTSFTDSGLFPNAIYYYKVRAAGTPNTISAYTNEDSAKTWNTAPVIVDLPATRTVRYGITTALTISASDSDGDALSFTTLNLPSFASLVDNGNRTATLTMNPTSAQQGTYNNVQIIVNDPNGGSDVTQFSLVVNSNYDPVISTISDYTLAENESVSIPLTATDQNAGNTLTWSASGMPNAFTLTPGANGSATLVLNPNYGASGLYTGQVTVADGVGGYATRTFSITVNDKNPNVKVYLRIRHDAGNTIGLPWNTITGTPSMNLFDEKGEPTTIGLTLTNGYNTGNSGVTTGNNSGVYPDAVLRDYYVFGAPWMSGTSNAILTGLNPSRKYSFSILGNSNWEIAADNGSTNYTVNGVTKSLYVQNNTANTVTFSNISPAADGTITIAMSKGTGASAGYLNAIVLSSTFDDGSTPIAPVSLVAQNISGQGVRLTWNNLAYNETGYEIYRSTSAGGTYTNIGTAVGADANTYLDGTVSGGTTYYYKIRAVSVSGLFSAYSDVVSILTINRIPTIAPISNVFLRNNQTLNVPVSASDDAGDQLTLTAVNLPQFATFTDNGNGTGTIAIAPLTSSVGVYKNVTVTAKDNSDSSRSTSFDITIIDKDLLSLYLNFSDGSLADKPWNNLAGSPDSLRTYTGFKDDRDSVWTSVSLQLKNGFSGVAAGGMRPGNGKEVYAPTVVRTGFYDNANYIKTFVVSGLSTSRKYNFVFFNSHDDGTNGNTTFTIGGVTVALNASYNINKTVQINGVSPNASGQVTISISKSAGNSDFFYLNAMVIQSYIAANTPFVGPTDLRVIDTKRSSITLQWQDRSDNETGFTVYRALPGGSYSSVGTVSANVTTFTDSGLTPNQHYYYLVRANKSASPTASAYSNVAKGCTYAYAIYVNFSNNKQAPAPWNNTATVPQQGYVWNSLRDDNYAVTSVGMTATSLWGGMYGDADISTGNNSGVYPDNVLVENYGLFPGQTATLKISGLNLNMRYDFTFSGSSIRQGDVNTAYSVNGKTVLLNTSMNRTGTVTLYGIVPDSNGEVVITTAPGTPASQFGLLSALVMQAYTPNNGTIPTPPARGMMPGEVTVIESAVTQAEVIPEKIGITAYPNPFSQFFTLTVTTSVPDKLDVLLYDINGRLVYQNRANNLNSGTNVIRVQPDKQLTTGVYFVRAILGNDRSYQLIKIVKQ